MSDQSGAWPQAAQRWVGIVGLVVAPTTLVTGLCYFFGFVSTRHRLLYFAVDSKGLGYTTTDYVVKSVVVLFFPIVYVLLACVVVVWLAVMIRRYAKADRYKLWIRRAGWVVIGVGVAALVRAIVGVINGDWVPDHKTWLTPLCLAAGTALLVIGYWMLVTAAKSASPRPFSSVERGTLGLAVAIMVVGVFWSTDIYAQQFGDRDGALTAQDLWRRDDLGVILETTEPLALPPDMVRESQHHVEGVPDSVSYRYDCLRVLEVSGDNWVLVPAKWEPANGYAVLVTPDAHHRITTTRFSGLANNVGMAENVKPFWQCPEVVRVFSEADLEGLLLDAGQAQSILEAAALTPNPVRTELAKGPAGPPGGSCAAMSVPNSVGAYDGSGFSASRAREMTAAGPAGRLWIDQGLVRFPTPDAAADFTARAKNAWLDCKDQVVTIQRGGVAQPRALGGVGVADNIFVVTDTAVSGPQAQCSHAIAAKSNLVIDVGVCGATKSLAAGSMAAAIRNKIPTQ